MLPDTDVLVNRSWARHVITTFTVTNIVVSGGILVIILVYIVLQLASYFEHTLQFTKKLWFKSKPQNMILPDILEGYNLVWWALRIPMFGIPRVEIRNCHRYDNHPLDTKPGLSPFYQLRQPGESWESAKLFEI